MDTQETYIKTGNAARMLGVTGTRICHMISEGLIERAAKDKHGHWWMPKAEIERLAEAGMGQFRRYSDVEPDGTVNITDAARALGVSRQRVHQLIAEGATFPGAFQREGVRGTWRIPIPELQAEIGRRRRK